MNVPLWKLRNVWHRIKGRVLHPPPFYKAQGGLNAIVNRADGSKENLGKVSVTYAKRWGVGSGH